MGFATPMTGPLKRMGLKGREAMVSLSEDGLVFEGSEATRATLPLEEIAKARFGFLEGRGTSHTFIRLRLTDGRKLQLIGRWGDSVGCAPTAWALAGALLARRSATVETGDGPFVPVVILGAFGGLAIASAVGTVWLWIGGDDWTTFLGAFAVCALLAGFLGPWAMSRYWPRRIETQDEVLRALPGFRPAGRIME